ncbi:ABC transporter substrate-binding protein [Paenibacillus sinopodophylli]|uniref:ABC transporter substrate-binding protein n=1 Tax=Paenibacillus sinopodophylli TaxID=1837342 RepID=UPI001FEC3B0C|nr:ABC transporter substrate-binding protein [Paenibacillus sinopodophylli]
MGKKMTSFRGLCLIMLALVLVLSACSGQKNGGSSNTPNDGAAAGTDGKEQNSELKPYELNVAYLNIGTATDMPEVQAAVNAITKEKINATVKFMPIDLGAWQQQINLMLAGNEKLDLLVTGSGLNFGTQAAKGQLVPLEDLLEKYGQDIKKIVEPDVLKAASSSGSIFGVPSVRDWAADYGVLMRKDLVDKYNIDLSTVKTFDDLDAVFEIIKKNEPEMAAIIPEAASVAVVTSLVPGLIDPLNDDNGVLPGLDNDLKVVNWFETEQYASLLTMVRRWYDAGFIPKDISTNQTASEQLVKAGKAFAFMAHMKPGYENKTSLLTGTEMVAVRILPPVATTSSISNIMFSIAKNSSDPERAMMFLNLLYSDAELVNLIDYGIEGKHYEVKGEVIGFPSGVDANTATYNPNFGWMWGNQFLSHVWEGDDPKVWELQDAFNKAATKSKAMGFSFTVDPVKTEAAAIQNVKDQFKIGLENGTLDPVKYLPEFIEKLKAAGMDKVIAEKQKQLDEWAAANK